MNDDMLKRLIAVVAGLVILTILLLFLLKKEFGISIF